MNFCVFTPVPLRCLSVLLPQQWDGFTAGFCSVLPADVQRYLDRFADLPEEWLTAHIKISTYFEDLRLVFKDMEIIRAMLPLLMRMFSRPRFILDTDRYTLCFTNRAHHGTVLVDFLAEEGFSDVKIQ
jgi:hypothetical protein